MAPNGVFKSTEVNNEVNFTINGTLYKVDSNVPSDTSLNTFIRNHAHLTGTKAMCHEGGCGSCIVTVTSKDPVTKASRTYAVNSCLVNVFSCQGWAVTTIEGIGNRKTGYHPVQARLAQFNGTQCGYCSPGMVMNMHSLLESKEVTMKEVENSFGGNICRCTGYRPILDAFKSFSTDATEELKKKVADIEDLHKVKICPKTGKNCKGTCDDNDELIFTQANTPIHIEFGGVQWYKTTALDEVFKIFDQIGDRVYRLVAGNTGQGVYRITNDPQVLIDIGNIPELKVISIEPTLKLGGGVTLTDAMNYFYKLATENPKYKYTKVLADHIDLIANVPVRNTGTIAGNLQMKNDHPEFPSDMFLMLETVGATINIAEGVGKTVNMSLLSFLDIDMKHKIIHSIVLPELDQNFNVRTFKIMPRAQNAHAYVNAGFLFKMKMNDNGKVLAKPTIVFGGISPQFFILGLSPQDLPDSLKSGGTILSRPVSTAKQDYETNNSVWPLNKPIPKIEAVAQCSGEAQYVGDLPAQPGELHGAFVLTTVAQGFIANIDPSEALSVPGVVSFISAKDIPGKNSFAVTELIGMIEDEEVFCSGAVKYAGQPVGLIVATSQRLALKATHKVKIEYSGVTRPQIDMREVIKSGDQSRLKVEVPAKEIKIPDNPAHVVKGRFGVGGQYHYTMETQSCVVVPIEDGLDVYPTSQWMDLPQVAISRVLNIPENRINVVVRRLGGGYGAKISRNSLISAACALAAHLLNKPVRIVMNLETNMEAIGKRDDATMDYEVGTDEKGKILYLKGEVYENCGHSWNEPVVGLTTHHMNYACYDSSNWSIQGFSVKTDVASNTYCRAPSSTEGIAMVENIMEHIAKELKMDPVQVRLNNFPSKEIGHLVEDFKVTAEYDTRKESVEAFNKEQRWKKRGIALVPMIYGFSFWGNFSAIVSIYAQDGTVAVSHGGIEMGQGLNTKVAQVVAHTLDIPLEFVSVKPSNNLTSPNGMVSGGSITSEACSYAAMVCCKELLKRMEPIKKDLKDPSWPQLTKASYDKGVDLCATHMFTTKDNLKDYNIYGVTICEVEVDLLTGQHQILRVDLLEDAGESLSPEVDIGQVEGAFIMGLGYFTMEQLTYSPDNGRLLTNRTWNYKPPGVKDIPIDFRVYLRKNAPNPFGVLRSKATGEPPLCMSCVILLALRNAIDAARKDAGNTDAWFEMDAPYTAERLFLSSLTNVDLFSL